MERARLVVYTLPRSFVLVKFDRLATKAMAKLKNLLGDEKRPYNPKVRNMEIADVADARQLNPHAYRKDACDTGHPTFGAQGVKTVRVTGLIGRLAELGLTHRETFWYTRPLKDGQKGPKSGFPVFTAVFAVDTEGQMPFQSMLPEVVEILEECAFQYAHVWANPVIDPNENVLVGRGDTVNLIGGRKRTPEKQPAQTITIPEDKTHTWRLEGEPAEWVEDKKSGKSAGKKTNSSQQPKPTQLTASVADVLGEKNVAALDALKLEG